MARVKELDDFLPGYVTPSLSARGYRKAGHTYRKRFESGDWGLFAFRGYPLGIQGSFLGDASYVPEPVWDWFSFTHPKLATKQPQAWWMQWSNPLGPRHSTGTWTYDTDVERELVGSVLVDRINEVAELFDEFGAESTRLLALALSDQRPEFEVLPLVGGHFASSVWRVCLLAREGSTPELESALAVTDEYSTLGLRAWADHYLNLAYE